MLSFRLKNNLEKLQLTQPLNQKDCHPVKNVLQNIGNLNISAD